MSIFAIKSVPSKNNEKTKNGRKQNGKTIFTEIVYAEVCRERRKLEEQERIQRERELERKVEVERSDEK